MVQPPPFTNAQDLKVQIFTTAFRLVREEDHPQPLPGVAVNLDLRDKAGAPLADGLYYILCDLDGRRSMTKLLILR